jgi:predicted nucleic acid-binding protein
LTVGARNRREEERIAQLEDIVQFLPITLEIARRAGEFTKHYRPSHGIDDADALIAATAEHHKLPLATLNVKHFPMFPKLKRAY